MMYPLKVVVETPDETPYGEVLETVMVDPVIGRCSFLTQNV